tara:strand:- start:10921 stop:11883 length:963 start_codon:yes stop_codon:yes gene_type:complete
MEVVDRLFDEVNSLSQKPIMYGVLGMLLGFYGPKLNPNLPTNIKDLFGNSLFRFLIIAVIICVSTKDIQLALMIGIGLMIGISFANSQDVTEKFSEHCGEHFINLSNDISEFYAEDFKNKDEKKMKDEEKEGDEEKKHEKKKQALPKKPVTQQEQDTSVPKASSEKDEGFNNINKYDNLDQFFGYSSSATGSPIEKDTYVNYQDEEAGDMPEMPESYVNYQDEEANPVEMFSSCGKREESDALERFVNYQDEESDDVEEGQNEPEEADEVEEGEDEPEEADEVEEGEDEPEEDDAVENFLGNRPSQYESQLRRTIANYSM